MLLFYIEQKQLCQADCIYNYFFFRICWAIFIPTSLANKTARYTCPVIAWVMAMALAGGEAGLMSPYPSVVMVTKLK